MGVHRGFLMLCPPRNNVPLKPQQVQWIVDMSSGERTSRGGEGNRLSVAGLAEVMLHVRSFRESQCWLAGGQR